MLKLNLMWWGKLNQWKIWKTEPMENLHQSLCTFKCRKVMVSECPCINVLSIETLSYLNVETKPRMKWCSDGETEPMENFHFENGISTSAIMIKIEKWPPFRKYASYRKISEIRDTFKLTF